MEKLPKVGLPILLGIILTIVIIAKSAVTIGSGEAGVLYKTFGGGVGTDEPPLGEGFHIVAPWNKVYIYEVRRQEIFEKMKVLSSNGLDIQLDASAWYKPDEKKETTRQSRPIHQHCLNLGSAHYHQYYNT